ncbi:MAG: hypothetical protein M3Q71_18220 [Chloroflexota bacterium]|nr:hypothetical protein [Chloroflexota bacterium]
MSSEPDLSAIRDEWLIPLIAEIRDQARAIGRLEAERDALTQRLAEIAANNRPVAVRPVLAASDELLVGYLVLEREERRYTEHALSQHGAMVAHWYRLLTLLWFAVESAAPPPDERPRSLDSLLRIQFIAAAAGTAKLVLDATLAGYYTQAFALIRHLLETWLRLEYLHARPDMAEHWYVGEDGRPPRPPGEGAIRKEVYRAANGDRRQVINRVIQTIDKLNVMAHPSPHTLQQTIGVHPNQYNFGANYDAGLCVGALHEGQGALSLILAAFNQDAPQSEAWRDELRAAQTDYRPVLDAEIQAAEKRPGDPRVVHDGGES